MCLFVLQGRIKRGTSSTYELLLGVIWEMTIEAVRDMLFLSRDH